jgi:AmiR/NasT family two-component response regulator
VHVNDLVANADLSFMTREFAQELPQRLAEHELLNQAVGVLIARNGHSAAEARDRIAFAATHAKASRADVARIVMTLDT